MSGTFFTIIFSLFTIFGFMLYELRWFVMIDEVFAFFIAGIAIVKILLRQASNYKPFLIWLCIDAFYLIYSIAIHSNTNMAILSDFIMESKPYMVFFGLLCIAPKIEYRHMKFIHRLSILCVFMMPIIYYLYPHNYEGTPIGELLSGAAYASAAIIISLLYYLSSTTDSLRTRIITFAIMSIGLLAPTSKYLGTLVCSLFILLFTNRPIKLNIKFIIILLIALPIIGYLIKEDFELYFLNNPGETARSALYLNVPHILNDYIPFGSGFASYANAASGTWYSDIYYQYGMDNIQGLVKDEATYVSDAYYPTLVQFGYIGIILFIIFIRYLIHIIYRAYQCTGNIKNYKVAIILLIFILIESTSGTNLIQSSGIMSLIIIILSSFNTIQPRSNMIGPVQPKLR